MDNSLNGRENAAEKLRTKFFRTEPKSNLCWTLIGPEQSEKTTLLQELAEEYGKKEHPKVFFVSYSVSDVKEMEGIASPYVWFWGNVLTAIAEAIPVEKLSAVMTLTGERGQNALREIQDIYNMAKNPEELSVLNVSRKVRRLFTLYTNLGVQILLALDAFEVVDTLFPYDAETDDDSGQNYLFNDLFSISGKGRMRLNLSILLISSCRLGALQRKVTVGSNVELAYPIISM